MKATVLVIGQNVERQLIELDENQVVFDEKQRAWLDVCFDKQMLTALNSKRHFSELGLLARTLKLLDYDVILPEAARNFALRLILQAGDNFKAMRVGQYDDYLWERPSVAPQVLILLESANLSDVTLAELERYLEEFPKIKLILEYRAEFEQSPLGRRLLERAKLIWLDLISLQTTETEALLEQFNFKQQLLLINHRSGLSLSDKLRSYKLTNADYLELKSLEWLAIAIKVLGYDFDVEDRLELIARIGQSIVRTNQANIRQSLSSMTAHNPEIELIRGEMNRAKIMTNFVRQLRQAAGLKIDLSMEKTPIARQLLMVRDLPSQSSLVVISEKQEAELLRKNLPALTDMRQKINLAVELEVRQRNLPGCGRERAVEVTDLDEKLNRCEFYQTKILKLRADFMFGRVLPSDRIILANARQLADFAGRCLSRGIVPIVEIAGVAQANFDWRPGAVALEYLRILRSLEVELRARQLEPGQVLIWLRLPSRQDRMLGQATAKTWINTILSQLQEYRLSVKVSFLAELDLVDFKAMYWQGVDLICDSQHNISDLLRVPRSDEDLRIKFSQFLAEF